MNTTQTPDQHPPSTLLPIPGQCDGQAATEGDGLASVPSLPLADKDADKFTWTVFPAPRADQKHAAHDGKTHHKTWADFCKWVESEHKNGVYAKGRGPHWNATANRDGHRCIDSTGYIYALHLDADTGEDWHTLLAYLDSAGAAYLAHRSASHSTAKPKWHLVLPLAEPYRCNGPGGAQAANLKWRDRFFHHARKIVGELAGLKEPGGKSTGFDPIPCHVAIACYLGHRRDASHEPREVRWRAGKAMDGQALFDAAPLPAVALQGASTGGFQTLSLSGGAGKKSVVTLPASTMITMGDGSSVTMSTLPNSGHVMCPQHGGKGHGTAFITHARDGSTGIKCLKCAGQPLFFAEDVIPPVEYPTGGFIGPIQTVVFAENETDAYHYQVRETVKLGRRLKPWARRHVRSQGLVKNDKCGFAQLIKSSKGKLSTATRRCMKPSCLRCETERLAEIASALLLLPLCDKETGDVGQPLGERHVWLSTLADGVKAMAAFKRRFNRLKTRAKTADVLKPSSPIYIAIDGFRTSMKSLDFSSAENAIFGDAVQGYAIVTVSESYGKVKAGIYVLSTIEPLAKDRQVIPTGKLSAIIKRLLEAGHISEKPSTQDDGRTNALEVPTMTRKISSSHTLTLDPQALHKLASATTWRVQTTERVTHAALAQACDESNVGAVQTKTDDGEFVNVLFTTTDELTKHQIHALTTRTVELADNSNVTVVVPLGLKPTSGHELMRPLGELTGTKRRIEKKSAKALRAPDKRRSGIAAQIIPQDNWLD